VKKLVITGGSGNLGNEVIQTFLSSNEWEVISVDIALPSKKNLENTKFKFNRIDFLDDELEGILDGFSESLGPIDLLINNAAFTGDSSLNGWNVPFEEQSYQSWEKCLRVNLTSAFLVSQKLTKNLARSSSPHILNISSIYGFLSPKWELYEDLSMNNPLAYNVSKAGIIQMTNYLSTYLQKYKIRVNCISPGGIQHNQSQKFIKRYEDKTPSKRMLTFSELAKIIFNTSKDEFEYVNGHNYIVDGGFSL